MVEPDDPAKQAAAQEASSEIPFKVEEIEGTERRLHRVSVGRFRRFFRNSPLEEYQAHWVSEDRKYQEVEEAGIIVEVSQGSAGYTDLCVQPDERYSAHVLTTDKETVKRIWRDLSTNPVVSQHSLPFEHVWTHRSWSEPRVNVGHSGIVRVTNVQGEASTYRIRAAFNGQADNWNVDLSMVEVRVQGA